MKTISSSKQDSILTWLQSKDNISENIKRIQEYKNNKINTNSDTIHI